MRRHDRPRGAGASSPQGIFRAQLSRASCPSGGRFESACHDELARSVALERKLAYENAADASDDNDIFSGCSSCLSYTPEGDLVGVAGPDCRVVVYDARRGKHKYAVEGHTEIVTGLAWARPTPFADGPERAFYTSSLDKSIRLWKGSRPVATYRDHYDWIRSLAISGDGGRLVSGCVSSNIFLWDTETGKTTCRTQAMLGLDEKVNKLPGSMRSFCTSFEYSVNSVDFFRTNDNLFVSGMRDGTVRMWDCRDFAGGAVATLFAHKVKLNQVQMGQLDSALLTSGRDNVIRLWDTRMMGSAARSNSGCMLTEFKSHKCRSYNISCTFFGSDRTIATGSEDSKIWLYDAKTGEVIQALSGHGSVVHNIAAPRHESHSLQLASSSIDSNEVNIWSAKYVADKEGDVDTAFEQGDEMMYYRRIDSVESQAGDALRNANVNDIYEHYGSAMEVAATSSTSGGAEVARPSAGDATCREDERMALAMAEQSNNIMEMHRMGIEALMRKHGDMILRIFHACDFSFRTQVDWRVMVQRLSSSRMGAAVGIREGAGGGGGGGDQGSHVSGMDQESVAEAVREMETLFNAIADEARNQEL
ncbi:WD40 repeat domain-containing protein [Chloropicon primus]|uniref:WD40 repeat domain-containing protein n=2 Tax=Chloropicon primus TaxID=1764295 RepID=A0A5B8MBS9_9CHLO|nr:WD40 repeat domain-containing protein [Chloropicon primus]UPQ96936.1 WD40 repeat domain-containing protein [Chloropicon primus]|eukprot:QDZ17719.1 WD40 repeat domain-containing protein [Chloropicon primus]